MTAAIASKRTVKSNESIDVLENRDNDKNSERYDAGDFSRQDGIVILREKKNTEILSCKNLLKRLQMAERAVQQNGYHRNILNMKALNLAVVECAAVVGSLDNLFGSGGGLGALVGIGIPSLSLSPSDAALLFQNKHITI